MTHQKPPLFITVLEHFPDLTVTPTFNSTSVKPEMPLKFLPDLPTASNPGATVILVS